MKHHNIFNFFNLNLNSNSLFGKLIRFPFKLIPKNKVLNIKFGHNKGFKWIAGSGVNGYWIGNYELNKINAIFERLRKGAVAYDIGAHVGYYTLFFSKYCSNDGYVYSFEPNPKNLFYLKEHIKINKIRNCTIFPIGLGDFQDYQYFYDNDRSTSEGIFQNDMTDLKIFVETIDHLVEKKVLNPPDLLKIDVEGYELKVINGAINTLKKHSPTLFIAIDDPQNKLPLIELLKELNYTVTNISSYDNEIIAFK